MANDLLTTDRLHQICARRLAVLRQLREQTIRQIELVDTGEGEQILTLLAQKQHLLDEIHDLQQQLLPFQSQDPDARQWASAELRNSCRQMVDEGQQILKELVAIESRSIDTLSRQRDSVASELQLHHSASTVRSAYDSHDLFEANERSQGMDISTLSLEG